jgi:hypothetical protein
MHGLEHLLSIDSIADAAGQDPSMSGFGSDTIYLLVGKLSGNGSAANTMQVSLFANGSNVPDFTLPGFSWMLTAQGGAGYNPTLSKVQITTPAEANYTISNLWIGTASAIPEPVGMVAGVAVAGMLARRRRIG